MRRILFLSDRSPDEVLSPALGLGADVKVEPPEADTLTRLPDIDPDLIVGDAAGDPERVHGLLAVLSSAGRGVPIIVVLAPQDVDRFPWEDVADDVVMAGASEAEVLLRLRLLGARTGEHGERVVRLGPVAINTETYQVTAGARRLDLTFKEFELVRFLAEHPGRVFSRAKLLQEVWGYDFFGGTRTVDVHVRRLRAKLGPEHEHLIETVRGVGYRASEAT
ncbi:MAG TPA: winged helix-turn-helix domain-containing protein [Actinomycetota bacterium]|nr:winged helix-turn-helix domain-containing protein [Actinomycetota bacterium]